MVILVNNNAFIMPYSQTQKALSFASIFCAKLLFSSKATQIVGLYVRLYGLGALDTTQNCSKPHRELTCCRGGDGFDPRPKLHHNLRH